MNKSQLTPGQLLGHRPLDSYRETKVTPVLLVGAEMWQPERVTDGKGWTPKTVGYKFKKARKGSVANSGHGYGNVLTGYLILRYSPVNRNNDRDKRAPLAIEQQVALLQAQADRIDALVMEAEDGTVHDDYRYGTELVWDFVSGRVLAGLWSEVYEGFTQATAKTERYNQEGRAWEKARNEDLREASTQLEELLGHDVSGALATYDVAKTGSGENGTYRSQGSVVLSLEDVQKLLTMVTERNQ